MASNTAMRVMQGGGSSAMNDCSEMRKRCEARLSHMRSDRSLLEPIWRDLRDYILPSAGLFYIGDERQQRGYKAPMIINSKPTFAANTLRSGMMAGVTSPARPWFRLGTPDPEMMEFQPVREWVHVVEKRMRDVFQKSNLYHALPSLYGEQGVFGTAATLALEDPKKIIRFQPITVGRYWLATSFTGEVDTIAREVSMTARQCAQEYGIENCSMSVCNMLNNGQGESRITVINLIEPNSDWREHALGPAGMRWRSLHWQEGGDKDRMLAVRGYESKPFMAPRWDVLYENVYGNGPGMVARGDCKSLQLQERRKAQAIDKQVDPPLQAPAHLRNSPISSVPGGVTFSDIGQSTQGVRSLYDVRFDHSGLLDDIAKTEERINSAFFADLFLMMSMSDRRQITAREIDERHEEKLLMLGPVLERLNQELLDPIIERTFDLMVKRNELPPPPEELQGQDLRIEYISILAQAQKLVGIGGVERLATFVGQLATMKPDVLDKLDPDQCVDDYAEMLGTSPRLVRSDEAVEQLRAASAQQQQLQMAAQAAQPVQQGAQAIKALADAPMGVSQANGADASVLGRLLENYGASVYE